ncbi:MAG: arginine--tRNA ligase [Deltaproteobacteria bacterium]|nr:arginine--tRNA ligase [Candidatus Zymogenaceae bacterium]
MVKEQLTDILRKSLSALADEGFLPTYTYSDSTIEPQIEVPKDSTHGDFASNIALVLASAEKKNPRQVAERIVASVNEAADFIEKMEVAGPGFINFSLKDSFWHRRLANAIAEGETFGDSDMGRGVRVQVEFVSANPTGPLHVGHARGAAVGDSLAAVLEAAGFDVQREYYINDAGVQMETLGKSVYARYREHFGKDFVYLDTYYQGEYIGEIAQKIASEQGERFLQMPEEEAIPFFTNFASQNILSGIKQDLSDFGIEYDVWFSEKSLYECEADGTSQVDAYIEEFTRRGLVFEKEGALWFNTIDYGDDKDRVVIKSDGEKTYLASDIAYHQNKYDRGFDRVINIWGADHHGYVVRMQAAIRALGRNEGDLVMILVQLVSLVRGGKPISMSTRAGQFVTLRQLLDEVGSDAVRYFMLMRSYDAHFDFDLDLATTRSQENPVFYVQYSHARICSILRQANEQDISTDECSDDDLARLVLPEEIALIKKILYFPDLVEEAARDLAPHKITFFLFDLASLFHSYYNHHRVITENLPLTRGRLALGGMIKTVVARGLGLLGISAPEKM